MLDTLPAANETRALVPAARLNPGTDAADLIIGKLAQAVADALAARFMPWLERIAASLARPADAPPLPPGLLSADDARAWCGGVSASAWAEWSANGTIPAPVNIGRRILWRRADLEAWIDAGCPGRARFEEIRAASQPPPKGRPR